MLQGGIADVPVSLSTVVAGQEQELCWWVAGFPRWIQIPPFIFGCFKQIFSKFIALLQSSCALDTLISPVWTVIKADIGASQNSRGVGHFISIFCYIYIYTYLYVFVLYFHTGVYHHASYPRSCASRPPEVGVPWNHWSIATVTRLGFSKISLCFFVSRSSKSEITGLNSPSKPSIDIKMESWVANVIPDGPPWHLYPS